MRTLKDVEQYSNARRHYAKSHLLKEVAIEWIKELERSVHSEDMFIEKDLIIDETNEPRLSVVRWIENFFNLESD